MTDQLEVELINVSGNDLFIVNALRKSFDVHHATWMEEPRGPRSRSDRQLILDCAADGDTHAWRHCHATLTFAAPVPIARQLMKHQAGFTWTDPLDHGWSEVSRRYKTTRVRFYTVGHRWRKRPDDVRQGTGDLLSSDHQAVLAGLENEVIEVSLTNYNRAITIGATPEQARLLLPQSLMVEWTWTGSLLGWAELYNKRRYGDRAQEETRELVRKIGELLAPHFPVAWPAVVHG